MRILLVCAALGVVLGAIWFAVVVREASDADLRRAAPSAAPSTRPEAAPVELAAPEAPTAPPEPAPSAAAPVTAPTATASVPSAPAVSPAPYAPPDAARFAAKHGQLDAAAALVTSRQLLHQVDMRAASVLAEQYHRHGRYTAYPYTYDARGEREPSMRSIPLEAQRGIHRVYDAPELREWHLVELVPEEHPGLYDLRAEGRWLGSRGRAEGSSERDE